MSQRNSSRPQPWSDWITEEQIRRYDPFPAANNYRTYFLGFCCLVQIQMLFNLPTPFAIDELEGTLPCSEEEWSASSEEMWWELPATGALPAIPSFQEAFGQLSQDDSMASNNKQYSEFGSYILISALLSTALEAHRSTKASTPDQKVFEKLDIALENWQRSLLHADPKNAIERQNIPDGALAFNTSAIYRATTVMRVKDYSR
jgi:hypothetical protein